MNFDEAVRAHSDWKIRLREYLGKADRSLDPTLVEQDNRCALGKWIQEDGVRFSKDPEFQALRTEHARFHRAAADLVRRADRSEKVSEATELGAKSPFAELSQEVVRLIMAMKRKSQSLAHK